MFVLNCSIQIAQYTFTQVHKVRVIRDIDLLSDTAKIQLPVSALFGNNELGFEKRSLESEIKTGDAVSITLGYKDVFTKEVFTGYVSAIYPNQPTVTIECEDAVYIIRKKRIHKNFSKTTLKSLLNYIVQGTEIEVSGDVPTIYFDKFLFKNANGAKALQKIKDTYGLAIYIDDNNQLYAGLKYAVKPSKKVVYNLEKNVIKHDLKFTNAEDVRLQIKVVGVKKDNTKVAVIVGDNDGERRTYFVYNVGEPERLKEIGQARLTDMKYTGYRGTLTGFFIPFADRGMECEIINSTFPQREGTYYIPKTIIDFGVNGARIKTELGIKL